MTLIEGREFSEGAQTLDLPGRKYNLVDLANQGFHHMGVGLLILRFGEAGKIEVLMGRHRPSLRSQEEGSRWSWLAETVAKTEAEKPTSDILARLVSEEMDRSLLDLEIYAEEPIIAETDLTKEGRRFMASVYTVWTDQDLEGPLSESEEVDLLKFFPVEDVMSGATADLFPLREFTISGLRQVAALGVFERRAMPRARVRIPERYGLNGYNPTQRLDLTPFKTV